MVADPSTLWGPIISVGVNCSALAAGSRLVCRGSTSTRGFRMLVPVYFGLEFMEQIRILAGGTG